MELLAVPSLGTKRDEFVKLLNKRAGKGNWYWAFQVGKLLYSWEFGLQLYEDAYWLYLKNHLTSLKELVTNYGDVYVIDKKDLQAGLDYKKQAQYEDHYSDIAIRRSLRRLGVWFKGDRLLKLSDSEFSDSKIPFHLTHLVKGVVADFLRTRVAVVAVEISDKHELGERLIR